MSRIQNCSSREVEISVDLEFGLAWVHTYCEDSMEIYPNVHQIFVLHILTK
jgi:hypothetical protein